MTCESHQIPLGAPPAIGRWGSRRPTATVRVHRRISSIAQPSQLSMIQMSSKRYLVPFPNSTLPLKLGYLLMWCARPAMSRHRYVRDGNGCTEPYWGSYDAWTTATYLLA